MNAEQKARISAELDAAHPYPASDQGGDAPAEPAPRQLAREYEAAGHTFEFVADAAAPPAGVADLARLYGVACIASAPDAPAALADRLAAVERVRGLADVYAEATSRVSRWGTDEQTTIAAQATINSRTALHAAIDALAGIPPEARRDASDR